MDKEAQAFEIAVRKTIDREGPANTVIGDKGGTTKWGISRAFLQSISKGEVSSAYVLGLRFTDALDIYRTHFWKGPRIHLINDDRLREAVFDQGVNRGPKAAIKNLQRAILREKNQTLAVDGDLGPKTLGSLGALEADLVLASFIKESQISYARLVVSDVSQKKFLVGWLNRTHTY